MALMVFDKKKLENSMKFFHRKFHRKIDLNIKNGSNVRQPCGANVDYSSRLINAKLHRVHGAKC